ncbi:unnamed protein product [Rotaria sp. Silwood1]|nr:unnamed protein product [Rotaria sp. Silwood1]CAF1368458.1 unnamed protein product [Rotaria sp. Silwood1]CAF1425889.1 unnamed protein product [Rotaria sp. Silwood1]CAF3614581.1 unnamed protein product [Rotaria sp. Silwood1]CAF3628255.1 unnamed protein product [Rotaria sp. Silwood1]
MFDRVYNPQIIYGEIAPIIENPSRNGTIQCYNTRNATITCGSKEFCNLDYDQRENKFRSRGCKQNIEPRVHVYDGRSYSSFEIGCNRDLCNNDETLSKIKTILINYGLIDDNGRRIAQGNIKMVSLLLMLSALIFNILYSL